MFQVDNFVRVEGAGSVNFTNSSFTTSCPACGATVGRSGSFEVTQYGWRDLAMALRPAQATTEDYETLLRVLRGAQGTGLNGDQTASKIRSEVPVFEHLGGFLADPKWQGVAMWLAAVVAVVGAILAYKTLKDAESAPVPTVNVHVDQPSQEQIEQWVKDALRAGASTPSDSARTQEPVRNQPCTCGSGIKFKKCCGAPGAPLHR